MRAQDKKNVERRIQLGASSREVARDLNVPLDEVRAIYWKYWRRQG